MIRTGIIGYGLSGRVFHAPFIDVVEGFELSKISTKNPEGIKMIHQRYPNTKVVSGPEDIINDPEIDLVIVTSPNTVHFSQAKESLLAGKHVVIEKPFTNTSAEADESAQKKASQRHEMEKQARDLQEISDTKGWAVSFRVDDDLQQTIIKVVDSDTQKMIRQIPSEELVNISKRIKAIREGEMGAGGLQGLLYDHKA